MGRPACRPTRKPRLLTSRGGARALQTLLFGRSNKQCEQFDNTHSDNQHCKCYGIVVQRPQRQRPRPPRVPCPRAESASAQFLVGWCRSRRVARRTVVLPNRSTRRRLKGSLSKTMASGCLPVLTSTSAKDWECGSSQHLQNSWRRPSATAGMGGIEFVLMVPLKL
jgi:hypothetical protein